MFWNQYAGQLSYLKEAEEEDKPSFAPPKTADEPNEDDSDYTLDDGTDDEGNNPDEPTPEPEDTNAGGEEPAQASETGEEQPAAEDDGSDEDYSLDDGTDDSGAEPENNEQQSQEDTTQDQSTEDTGDNSAEGTEGADDEGDGSDEDYSLDDTGSSGEGEDTPSDDTSSTDDGSGDAGTGNDSDTGYDPRQKLRDLENSIFDQLAEDQKASKIKELKGLYDSTYYNCKKIINNIDQAPKTPDNVKIYEYVTTTLNDLMRYIKDYLRDSFDNRTYMENVTEFEKYISILDAIKKVFLELKKDNKDSE